MNDAVGFLAGVFFACAFIGFFGLMQTAIKRKKEKKEQERRRLDRYYARAENLSIVVSCLQDDIDVIKEWVKKSSEENASRSESHESRDLPGKDGEQHE